MLDKNIDYSSYETRKVYKMKTKSDKSPQKYEECKVYHSKPAKLERTPDSDAVSISTKYTDGKTYTKIKPTTIEPAKKETNAADFVIPNTWLKESEVENFLAGLKKSEFVQVPQIPSDIPTEFDWKNAKYNMQCHKLIEHKDENGNVLRVYGSRDGKNLDYVRIKENDLNHNLSIYYKDGRIYEMLNHFKDIRFAKNGNISSITTPYANGHYVSVFFDENGEISKVTNSAADVHHQTIYDAKRYAK